MEKPLILVVDDHEDSAIITLRILGSRGFEVEIAGTGSQALAMVAERPYAVVLLDVRLPDYDGLELALGIRKLLPETPILYCSAQAETATIERCLSQCGEGYFCKPLDWVALMAEIRRLIDSKDTTQQDLAA